MLRPLKKNCCNKNINKMKRYIVFLFVIACGNVMAQTGDWFSYAAGDFADGEGTSTEPYMISTPQELAYLAKMVRDNHGWSVGKYFSLDADIDLNEHYWQQPIGNSDNYRPFDNDFPFEGTFDGGGHSIAGFYQSIAGNEYQGLFGWTRGAEIFDLTVEGGVIEGMGTYNACFIGFAEGTTVNNCAVKDMTLYQMQEHNDYAGGFIGRADESIITGCSFSGNIRGRAGYTGGFIGYSVNLTATDCFSEGTASGANDVGGFIGHTEEKCDIQNCYSTSDVTGVSFVGGFIGPTYGGPITITGCHATGSVVAVSSNAGGFIAHLSGQEGINITDCHAEGNVTGFSGYVGGFVGNVGGNGYVLATISDCYSTGAVEGKANLIGGFVGSNASLTINRCYSTGIVKGEIYTGGFSGFSRSSYISDCYSVGAVEGDDTAGGFIGLTDAGTVTNCFAAGAVISGKSSAAFVASIWSPTTFINCYFDRQTTGLVSGTPDGNVSGIRALSTSQMTDKTLSEVFSENDWVFSAGYYPQLAVFADENVKALTKLRSALSVVPLQLANDEEHVGDVQTFFKLTDKTPAGNTIIWTADSREKATVVNNAVYAEKFDAWRTLTLYSGDAERKVKFRSTKNLMTADILGVKINGAETSEYNEIDSEFVHTIKCGSNEELVLAEIKLGGYANCTPASPMTLYANIPQNVVVTTTDGQLKTYTFVAEKPLPSDIFVRRWDDVLAINNNFSTNGGYEFTDYKWFKDGVEQPETKGYIRLSGGSAEYTATLSGRSIATQQNVTRTTCPTKINGATVKAAVYPNPVQRGQSIQVTTGIPAGESGSAVIQLFGQTGNLIIKQTLHNSEAEITMPDAAGAYILQLTVNGVGETYKVVVE